MSNNGFAVWITGLPGSGKSTIAKSFLELLKKNSKSAVYLNMDSMRKNLIKNPKYTEKERDLAYKKFADIGISEFKKDKNVVLDATAHKLKYRDYARKSISNFVEVQIKCPLKECMQRETDRKGSAVMNELYRKAIIRKRTGKKVKGLGGVIGIDIQYEFNKNAEIIINSSKASPSKAAIIIFDYLFS